MKLDLDKIKKEVAIIYVALQEQLKGFKPLFGVESHLSIVKEVGKINEMMKELKIKIASAKGGATLAQEIVDREKRLIESLKNLNK